MCGIISSVMSPQHQLSVFLCKWYKKWALGNFTVRTFCGVFLFTNPSREISYPPIARPSTHSVERYSLHSIVLLNIKYILASSEVSKPLKLACFLTNRREISAIFEALGNEPSPFKCSVNRPACIWQHVKMQHPVRANVHKQEILYCFSNLPRLFG